MREQALEQNNLIREQNRLLEEQARRERNARLEARQEVLDRYREDWENEQQKQYSAYRARYIAPLLEKSCQENINKFIEELCLKYEKPKKVDFDKYRIKYIDFDFDTEALLAYSTMGNAAFYSKDQLLKARFSECEKAMKDIRSRIPPKGGILASIITRSEVKRLRSEADAIIDKHNQLLEEAKKKEEEYQKEYNLRIEQFEWQRLQSFDPYLEFALERMSEASEKYSDGEFVSDYRLKYFNYPPEYEEFKAKIIEQENNASASSSLSGDDFVSNRRRRRRQVFDPND